MPRVPPKEVGHQEGVHIEEAVAGRVGRLRHVGRLHVVGLTPVHHGGHVVKHHVPRRDGVVIHGEHRARWVGKAQGY